MDLITTRTGWARFTLAALVCAQPAAADQQMIDHVGADFIAFLSKHGCTLSPQSEAAAIAAGFDGNSIGKGLARARLDGHASKHGTYIVLHESICSIALPEIESRWSLADPEVRAMAPYIKEIEEYDGETFVTEGCYLFRGTEDFTALNGGDAEAGFQDYISFMGASMAAGDLRFYETSPLRTPPAPQVTAGDCARAPNVAEINATYPYFAEGFGKWVRFVREATSCGDGISYESMAYGVKLQGVDPFAAEPPDVPFNAHLGYEFRLIALGAGWFEGARFDSRGLPRPPLCHVPE